MNSQMNRGQLDGEQCDKCQMRNKKEKEKQTAQVYSNLLYFNNKHTYLYELMDRHW